MCMRKPHALHHLSFLGRQPSVQRLSFPSYHSKVPYQASSIERVAKDDAPILVAMHTCFGLWPISGREAVHTCFGLCADLGLFLSRIHCQSVEDVLRVLNAGHCGQRRDSSSRGQAPPFSGLRCFVVRSCFLTNACRFAG